MAQKYMELSCRDVAGIDCDFVTRAEAVEQVIEQCAEHATNMHGMKSFPPELWAQMRKSIRVVQG